MHQQQRDGARAPLDVADARPVDVDEATGRWQSTFHTSRGSRGDKHEARDEQRKHGEDDKDNLDAAPVKFSSP